MGTEPVIFSGIVRTMGTEPAAFSVTVRTEGVFFLGKEGPETGPSGIPVLSAVMAAVVAGAVALVAVLTVDGTAAVPGTASGGIVRMSVHKAVDHIDKLILS